MILVDIYIVCALGFGVIDEISNLENPKPRPSREYILCNWNEKDFYNIDGVWVLRKECSTDKGFKRKARESYYKKKGLQK